jgi:nitroreductase
MTTSASALEQRYAGIGTDSLLTRLNPAIEQMLQHRSVRAYLPDALPAGTLETLVAAAQSASTSSHLQAWSVVAVENPQGRERLAVLAGNQAHVAKAPLFLVWLADLARLREVSQQRQQAAAGLDYLELLLVAVVDAALAAQNAVVALEALDLSCVYIGGLRNHPEKVAVELNLPPGVFAVFGMCVGYQDPARPADIKPRLPQSVVLHRELYSLPAQTPGIAEFDQVLAAFYASQGMRQADWSDTASKRVASVAALTGRDRMFEALRNLGFPLR